jgi:hypothetical protein
MKEPDVAIFGSAARGSSDEASDYDVIAVFEDTKQLNKPAFLSNIEEKIGRQIGLSVYSVARLAQMWADGSPFAWHLFLEAKPIQGFASSFLNWPAPSPYTKERALSDCLMMRNILTSAYERLCDGVPGSQCYEAGLVYVCARNTGMFASELLNDKFEFGRYAPFVFKEGLAFPLDRSSYETFIRARLAGTRGLFPPQIDIRIAAGGAECVLKWNAQIVEEISSRS